MKIYLAQFLFNEMHHSHTSVGIMNIVTIVTDVYIFKIPRHSVESTRN